MKNTALAFGKLIRNTGQYLNHTSEYFRDISVGKLF